MLQKKQRVTTAQFKRFFASGGRLNGTHLQLIYTPHEEFHGAVVVGKKILKSAVRRNRLRRRIYNALYRTVKAEELTGVFIFVAKPPAISAEFGELASEVRALIGRARK